MDDLRLLRVLREVALRGSFSAAAEALSYSQPAVSQQIARLEAQTGVKLIERQPKGVKLTPAGEALVRHTESILSQLQHAQAELTEIASSARGKLRLAGLGVERLMDDVLYASLPADHPLATRRAISLTDLCDEEWMLVGLRGTCADSNIVLRACQQAGFEPRVAYTSDDYFAIQGLVASGMGVALVPGLALVGTRDDVAVRPLRGRPPYRRIGAVFPPDPVGPVAVMVDCLRDAAEDYKRLAPMSAVATAA
jgi:DNA-binding transcriptional LysR family regulator